LLFEIVDTRIGWQHEVKMKSGNNFAMGLAFVKKIADYHHFTIEVFSKPGEGSRFIIRK